MVSALKVGGRRLLRAGARGRGGRAGARGRCTSTSSSSRTSSPGRTRRRRSGSRARAARTSARSRPISAPRSAGARTSARCAGCASAAFTLDDARPLEAIEADPDAAVRTPTEAVRDLERVAVDAERARAVAHGATFAAPALLGDRDGAGPFAVVDDAGALLAVYERRGGGREAGGRARDGGGDRP